MRHHDIFHEENQRDSCQYPPFPGGNGCQHKEESIYDIQHTSFRQDHIPSVRVLMDQITVCCPVEVKPAEHGFHRNPGLFAVIDKRFRRRVDLISFSQIFIPRSTSSPAGLLNVSSNPSTSRKTCLRTEKFAVTPHSTSEETWQIETG